MQKKEFTPQVIGRPDPRKKANIINAYTEVLNAACSLQMATEYCLREVEGFGINFFLESLKEGTEIYIRRKFIELNKVNIPGISTEKLMQSDLLDIEDIDHAIGERRTFDIAWDKVQKTGFIYPLRKLYVNEDIGWDLTPEFHKEVDKAASRFTENDDQNLILTIVKNLCDALNDLDALDILRSAHGPNEIHNISDFVEIDKNDPEGPFIISDILFYQHRLRRFREKPNFKREKKTYKDFIE